MKLLGNIIWVIFGGFVVAAEYVASSLALMATIIGIPFGIKTLQLAILSLWPFGAKVSEKPAGGGCLDLTFNIIWFFIGGIWIWLTHIFFGLLFYITIIGIPFGKQHFKMAKWALAPFGKTIAWP